MKDLGASMSSVGSKRKSLSKSPAKIKVQAVESRPKPKKLVAAFVKGQGIVISQNTVNTLHIASSSSSDGGDIRGGLATGSFL